MSTGQVKWFNNAKGFGFILPDGGGDDLFAHYSAIGMEGYKTLKAGQMVSFETIEGPKGLHAANIQPLSTPSAAPAQAEAQSQDGDEVDNAGVEVPAAASGGGEDEVAAEAPSAEAEVVAEEASEEVEIVAEAVSEEVEVVAESLNEEVETVTDVGSEDLEVAVEATPPKTDEEIPPDSV